MRLAVIVLATGLQGPLHAIKISIQSVMSLTIALEFPLKRKQIKCAYRLFLGFPSLQFVSDIFHTSMGTPRFQ